MLRLEMLSPGRAAEEVRFDWIAERECLGCFSAKNDHVGVVRRRCVWSLGWRCFAIQTAFWKDGFDGADDGGGDG